MIGGDLRHGLGRTEQDRLCDLLLFQANGGGDDARILAFRQNDFAIAPTCDIKQPVD